MSPDAFPLRHLPDDTLVAYWLAELEPGETERVEHHFLGCAECSAALESIAAWCTQLRILARSGDLRVVISQPFLDRLAAQGFTIRQYAPPAGGHVHCTVTPADDLLIARLAAELRGHDRLDLSFCDASGAELVRLADIPFDPASAEIVYNEHVSQARALGPATLRARLLAVEGASETELAHYTFHHSPTV